jgi:hypothetical protein
MKKTGGVPTSVTVRLAILENNFFPDYFIGFENGVKCCVF